MREGRGPLSDRAHRCPACGSEGNGNGCAAREMMLGLREEFQYYECGACGCLVLRDEPADWSRYYPAQYYSLTRPRESWLKRKLKRARARRSLGGHGLLGRILVDRWGAPAFADWMLRARVGYDSPIVDVGAGNGDLLRQMHDAGFTHLIGIEPYIACDADLAPGLKLLKGDLERLCGTHALLMFNHSFEHLEDPRGTLLAARERLDRDGSVLIRMPVAGTLAWQKYGVNWVQLDAPRHICIQTVRSMGMLATQTGFELADVLFDSTGFQFWGSEQYVRDVPLMDPQSHAVNPHASRFQADELARFESEAVRLNHEQLGDQACFYLRPIPRSSRQSTEAP